MADESNTELDVEELKRSVASQHRESQVEACVEIQDLLVRLHRELPAEQMEIALLLAKKRKRKEVAAGLNLPVQLVDSRTRSMRRAAERLAQNMGLDLKLDLGLRLSSKAGRNSSQEPAQE